MTSADKFVPSQPRAGILVRIRRRAVQGIPLGVWVLSIGAVCWLAQERTLPLDYPGMALVARHTVTSPTTGLVAELLVTRDAVVAQGQILGRLDGGELELRARKAQHVIAELRAEIERERELQETAQRNSRIATKIEHETDVRRFTRDVENAQLDLLEARARAEERRIRLTGLEIDLKRQKGLTTERLFSEAELVRTQTEVDALKERIARTEAVIEKHNERIAAVQARLASYTREHTFEAADLTRVLGPYQWRIAQQQTELELLALETRQLVIRAPVAGRVLEVRVHAGHRVEAGGPVLIVMDEKPHALVTYVPQAHLSRVLAGTPALLERATQPGKVLRTTVLSVGPEVLEVPRNLLTVPGVAEWRVPVYLALTAEISPFAGESVRVRILPPGADL